MIEKSKKDKIFEPFEDDLFCQEHVDIINEKVEKNIPTLLGNDIYLDIDDKIVDLNLKLNLSLQAALSLCRVSLPGYYTGVCRALNSTQRLLQTQR